MSEADDVLLGRADLEQAFTALGERLARRGVVADVFVVGGTAMALAYDASRVTRDVDARFLPHGIVLEEARRVADDLGLPPWWLNEQASVYISHPLLKRYVLQSLFSDLWSRCRSARCAAHPFAVTLRYLLPGRAGLADRGQQPGAVVVPSGGGLVAPSAGGPAQGEGEPGAGDQPGGGLRGQAGQPRGLGDRQPDGAEAGRARLAAADGHRSVAEGDLQVGVVNVIAGVRGRAVASGGGRRLRGRGRCRRTGRCGWRPGGAGRGRPGRCAGRSRPGSAPGTGPSRGRLLPVLNVSSAVM